MDASALRDLGLTDSETKVYLALLELGDATRGDIVDRSRIAGSKVYEVLEKLHEKGLATTYVQNRVKHFKATNPAQLLAYLERKREEIRTTEAQVRTILPSLLASYDASRQEQEVEFVSGLQGYERLFRDQIELLAKGEMNYVIGGTKGADETDVVAFFQKIHVMREAKGIRTKMLYNARQKPKVKEAFGTHRYALTETRYIEHTAPVAINIYRDHVIISIYGAKLTAIHIKSEDVAQSFLEYFEILWKGAHA